ncbi:hypothetical protein ACHAC9_00945 [Massilia sp. CMS3.1]|uniref:hypothetical protein n=1 Tax=Massilia sp. CMS3.1 TaxID=3373083 RepID=UPI003EE6814C
MDYKTILVHADLSRHAQARVELAARQAAQHGAHLIGAYGHSPFHELILGGASRTVLADSTTAVLMAH